MAEKFNIKLTIAGKSYPIPIDRDKEEKYRRAEKEVNRLVSKYKTMYVAEPNDYLAMAALQLSLNNVEMEMSRSLGDDIDNLVEIDAKLDQYLNAIK